MNPTKVQREVLGIMLREDCAIDDCYDHEGWSVGGDDRHVAYRTVDALADRGWIASTQDGYLLTEAGRAVLAGKGETG